MRFRLQLLLLLCLWLSTSKAQVLLYENFEGSVFPPTGWTITNNGSGNQWIQNTNASYASVGTKSMVYSFTSSAPASAWIFTPSIALDSADTVTITFDQRVGLSNLSEALKVTVGLAADIVSQTTVLYSNTNLTNTAYTQRSATFVAPVSGTYFFAFNCYSVADKYRLYVDNIRIAKPITTNAKLQSLSVVSSGCEHTASEPIAISVKNTGIDTIQQFTAQYAINGGSTVSETVSMSIAPNTAYSYTFSALANLSATGTYTINANVVLANDGDPYDDSLSVITEHISSGQFVKSFNGQVTIPDNSNAGGVAPIVFCGLPTILGGINLVIDYVKIDSINHTWISDLSLYLISPYNDSILLSANNGGGEANIINVIFTDTAQTNINSINSGGIPSGYYHTENLLGLSTFNFYNNPDFNGAWKLKVKDAVGGDVGKICKWTLALKLQTAIKELEMNDMATVYPNPTTGNVQISLNNKSELIDIQIVDMTGKAVFQEKAHTTNGYFYDLELGNYKKGIYFLCLKTPSSRQVQKLLIY
jgi:subtilisin-like proprotein convertase family protein